MNRVYILFTHCAYSVHVLKNIKNESHNTIYPFKNYFATMFSVFSNNKFNPNTPIIDHQYNKSSVILTAVTHINDSVSNPFLNKL